MARKIPSAMPGRRIAVIGIMTLTTLLVLEIVLTLAGFSPYFPEVPIRDLQPVTWRKCHDLGCNYVYEATVAACAKGIIAGRRCLINRQGFADSDDFVAPPAARVRVLVLGDSFTEGYSADIGHSYVETLEYSLPDVLVWNGAISGNGTHESLAVFNEFAPLLQPQLTILGFYMNDYEDNMMPVGGGWVIATKPNGDLKEQRYHRFDRWGYGLSQTNINELFAYGKIGMSPPANAWERAIGKTRLGTLLLKWLDLWAQALVDSEARFALKVQATRQYLSQLRDAASALDSRLLVLVIPSRLDIHTPSERYQTTLALMQELKIPFMDLKIVMRPGLYHEEDPHWNNAGHREVGALLSKCVAGFIESGKLADCENIVMPLPQKL